MFHVITLHILLLILWGDCFRHLIIYLTGKLVEVGVAFQVERLQLGVGGAEKQLVE